MNAKTLAASNYAGLVATEAAPKKLQIEAVQYIHGMCIELDIPVENVDLTTMGFGLPTGSPMLDRREINKSLMAFQALRASKVARLSEEHQREIETFLKGNTQVTDKAEEIRRHMNEAERQAIAYSNNAVSYLAKVSKYQNELEQVTKMGGKDWKAIIGEIVADGFFKYSRSNQGEGYIEFIAGPVNCTSVKKIGDERLSVDMGEYKFKLYPRDGYIQALAHSENRMNHGCSHPFIHGNDVCWGSASPEVARAAKEGDVGKMFALLRSLLTTYESTNPYRPLESFLNPACTKWQSPYKAYNGLSVGIHRNTKLPAPEMKALSDKIWNDSKFHPVWCNCELCRQRRVNAYGNSEATMVGVKKNEDLSVDYTPPPPEPVKEEPKAKEATKEKAKRTTRKPKIQSTRAVLGGGTETILNIDELFA